MKNGFVIVTTLAVLALTTACGGGAGEQPTDVAQNFWDAVIEGDIDTARKHATRGSADSISINDDQAGSGEFTLGEQSIDGDKATVSTSLVSQNDGAEMKMELETVLLQEDGAWKVDFDQTMMSMFGGAMGAMMEGMGKAMQEGMEEMARGLQEGMEQMAAENDSK